jgi:hypothetical protein
LSGSLEHLRQVPRFDLDVSARADFPQQFAVGEMDAPVADEAVVNAVVVVPRVILGHDEVDRALTVVRVLQVRTVAVAPLQQPAGVLPRAPGIIRVHVIGIVIEASEEVQNPSGWQSKQVGVGDVVAAEVGRVLAGRFERQRGPPRERVLRLGEAVVDSPLATVFRVYGQITPVRQRHERGAIVIVLFEVLVHHGRADRLCLDVVHADFDVSPSGICVVGKLPMARTDPTISVPRDDRALSMNQTRRLSFN